MRSQGSHPPVVFVVAVGVGVGVGVAAADGEMVSSLSPATTMPTWMSEVVAGCVLAS